MIMVIWGIAVKLWTGANENRRLRNREQRSAHGEQAMNEGTGRTADEASPQIKVVGECCATL